MFDVAYQCEASIFVAEVLENKFWNKLKGLDCKKVFGGFPEMVMFARYREIRIFYEILFLTHGGI